MFPAKDFADLGHISRGSGIMGQLSLTLALGEREGAYSCLRRLAARNLCSINVFCTDLGLNLNGIVQGQPQAVGLLAQLGGADLQSLLGWTPLPQGKESITFRGMTFRRNILSPVVARICPLCVAEDLQTTDLPRHIAVPMRSDWQFEFCFRCPKHATSLVVCRQWPDVSAFAQRWDGEPDQLTAFDQWVFHRLSGSTTNNWLDQFDFQASLDICDLVGQRLSRGSPSTSLGSVRAATMATGFDLLSQGPKALTDLFERWFRQAGPDCHAPRAVFGGLYANLQEHFRSEAYAPFRQILRSYILNQMPVTAGTDLLGRIFEKPKFHSVASAAQEAGISMRQMQAALKAAGKRHLKTAQTDPIIKASALTPIILQQKRAVSRQRVQDLLQITSTDFDALIMAGRLKPVLAVKGRRTLWDLHQATGVIEQLLARAQIMPEPHPAWLRFNQIASRWQIKQSTLIFAGLSGQLTTLAYLEGERHYRRLRINLYEARALFG